MSLAIIKIDSDDQVPGKNKKNKRCDISNRTKKETEDPFVEYNAKSTGFIKKAQCNNTGEYNKDGGNDALGKGWVKSCLGSGLFSWRPSWHSGREYLKS